MLGKSVITGIAHLQKKRKSNRGGGERSFDDIFRQNRGGMKQNRRNQKKFGGRGKADWAKALGQYPVVSPGM